MKNGEVRATNSIRVTRVQFGKRERERAREREREREPVIVAQMFRWMGDEDGGRRPHPDQFAAVTLNF
jgi:hypothetical protein